MVLPSFPIRESDGFVPHTGHVDVDGVHDVSESSANAASEAIMWIACSFMIVRMA